MDENTVQEMINRTVAGLQKQLQDQEKAHVAKLKEMQEENDVKLKEVQDANDVLQRKLSRLNIDDPTDKQNRRDLERAIKDHKENVPALTLKPDWPGNWHRWKETLGTVLELKKDFGLWLGQIKPTGDDVTTIKPLPEKQAELEAVCPATGAILSTSFQTFFIWLKSKCGDDVAFLYDKIDQTYPHHVRLFVLWTNILNKFGVNNSLVRETETSKWGELTQKEGESFDVWAARVDKRAKRINELYAASDDKWAKSGLSKMSKDDVWTKVRSGLTGIDRFLTNDLILGHSTCFLVQ